MNALDDAEGTGESEQSAPTEAQEQITPKEREEESFIAQALRAAKEAGHDIGNFKLPEAVEEKPVIEPTASADADTETLEQEVQPEDAEVDTDAAPKEELEKDKKVPLSALLEERQKKSTYKTRAEKAEIRVQELEQAVAKATAPRPTEQNPFSDIYDETGLKDLEASYEDTLRFAETHRDGAQDVLVGQNKDGSEIRRDFTSEEIGDMRYKADRALRKQLPERKQFLKDRQVAIQKAVQTFPDYNNQDSEFFRQAAGVIQNNPNLEQVLGPDTLYHIGVYLKGLALIQNGQNGAAGNDNAKRIVQAAKVKVAPTPTRTTAVSERRSDADLASAQAKFQKSGSAEDAAAYLMQKALKGQQGTVKQVARAG